MTRTKWIIVGVGVAIILAILFLSKKAKAATKAPVYGPLRSVPLGNLATGTKSTAKPIYGPASAAILTGRISGARDVLPVSDGNSTGGATTYPQAPPPKPGGSVSGTNVEKELKDSAKVAAFTYCVQQGGDPTACRLASGLSIEGAQKIMVGLEAVGDTLTEWGVEASEGLADLFNL